MLRSIIYIADRDPVPYSGSAKAFLLLAVLHHPDVQLGRATAQYMAPVASNLITGDLGRESTATRSMDTWPRPVQQCTISTIISRLNNAPHSQRVVVQSLSLDI